MVTGNLGRIGGYAPLSVKDGCYFDEREQGFTKEYTPTDVKTLTTSMVIESREVYESQEYRFELIRLLAKKLIETESVEFKLIGRPSAMYGTTPLLTASLKYLEPKGRNNDFYVIPEDVFSYNNQKWTQEEIFESLRNTFPERFI